MLTRALGGRFLPGKETGLRCPHIRDRGQPLLETYPLTGLFRSTR